MCGLEPQQIVDMLEEQLSKGKILTNPQVTLIVKQYASKRVSIIGQVNKPGSMPGPTGCKLVDALSQSGGSRRSRTATRRLRGSVAHGKTVTVDRQRRAIADGAQPDIPLQAGDTIKVEARVF